jgi:hypothetical protein
MKICRRILLLGALLLLVGASLLWKTATSITGIVNVAGYKRDGCVAGGISLLLLIGALLAKGKPGQQYFLL